MASTALVLNILVAGLALTGNELSPNDEKIGVPRLLLVRDILAQRSAAEKDLDSALVPLLALGQSYPQLNSSNNFLNLQDNLADTENKLAFARQYYNDAAATVNTLVATVPWMFFAPMAGVRKREFYEAPAGQETPPTVSF